ncbi:hypothetical protein SPAB_04971 [Salmonella enterica subsp. enterica serovar Paratyphi B str. SPB7]|uniref:Uncharacterized protein n=1 Tax=Salmonella paratyphi B (strain ATCC BAA-1250 / SPB7) TaxID=1016998 RepID=A0A6C6Z8C1_SALPB|nr:hypothetical protein SPAB_04971 [Salmonella enterica subsp. enterica serovar Paratyphi B str. SPB7]
MQHSHRGAALLHDGAHDNAFWGQCESWHRFRFIFLRRHGQQN